MIPLVLLIPGGLLMGVLINYLADVLPITRRFTPPVCPACEQNIPWRNYLRARPCAACGKKSPLRHFYLPVLAAITTVWFWYWPPKHMQFWPAIILLAYFALVAITDIEYRLILHPVSLVGAGIALVIGWIKNGITVTLLGGLAGFGAMLVLYLLGALFARYLSKRRGEKLEDEEALGFGDVNLCGVIGLVLGWPAITAGLFLGILLGGVAGAGIMLVTKVTKRYQPYTFIPYGPFLIASAVILLYLPW